MPVTIGEVTSEIRPADRPEPAVPLTPQPCPSALLRTVLEQLEQMKQRAARLAAD
jgi:hypothetical protein